VKRGIGAARLRRVGCSDWLGGSVIMGEITE